MLTLLFSLALAIQSPGEVRGAFEDASKRIESVDLGDVIYRRYETSTGAGAKVLREVLARGDGDESIMPLLSHADGRVRSLALIALFDHENPALLPRFVELANDGADGIPDRQAMSIGIIDGKPTPPPDSAPFVTRSVGDYARAMVAFYMERASFRYGIEGRRGEPGFAAYWAARRERAACASWMLVRLERAYGGVRPFQARCLERVREVRAAVDALPALDRALTLLWLMNRDGGCQDVIDGKFATRAECLEAARSLGRDNLLAILRRNVPGGDPDLRLHDGSNPGPYPMEYVARFVLVRARELLLPEDAKELLSIGRMERSRSSEPGFDAMTSAYWDIAAANLDPANAAAVIDAAYEQCRSDQGPDGAEERAELMKARWQSCASEADAWLCERFYSESLDHDFSPPARSRVLQMFADDASPRARSTMLALVRHPGFARIDVETLRCLVLAINVWVDPDLIDANELWRTGHPWGDGRLRTPQELAEAAKQWPDPTRKFLALLETWRAKVVASIAAWAPPARAK